MNTRNALNTVNVSSELNLMNLRSTYAFDKETVKILKNFSLEWGVSQAEVIRRSLRIALSVERKRKIRNPMEVLTHLDKKPLMSVAQAKKMRDKIKQSKSAWK
jgi:hypothetical protein